MKKYFIPTYEQCLEMVSERGTLVFYETKFVIDGIDVSCFNYRLSQYTDFIEPIQGKNYNAKELRGLTFVYENGKYNHFLMLNKFWNINQVPETLLHEIKDKKIKSVYNKEDGTLVTFIKVNGKIVSKTKMGFENEQTIEVDKIVKNNANILKFVDDCFNKDLVTMWEYTSFKNRIVLEYNTSELTLLKVRNNKTGEYVDVEQFRGLGFNVVESLEFTDLESLMKRIEDATKIEGCVITFEDDQMVKWKAKEYCELHHMIDDLNREDYVISLILNEMIDDFLSKLNKNSDYEKVKWIENIELKIRKYITQRTKDVDELVSKYNGSMKDFALSYLKDKNFALAAKVIKGDSTYDTVKKWILSETSKLGKARELLKNINL
jgi:T4 RnlA family RNA ligase